MTGLKDEFLAYVQDDLVGIEKALRENLNPYLDLVHEAASHLLFSGGKRFRPLLMILSARLCGYTGNRDKLFSTAFEYIHAATLLHDDIVDDAALRRGKTVAHAIWGGATAVLVGDFLLARALAIGAKTGRLKVIEVLAEVTEHMAQGEIHQLMRKGQLELSETEYLEVIRRKTAVLIQGACRVGAIISDAPESEASALSRYGLNLGMAFQMADDLLDYIADTRVLGKEVGADLREGKLTLPVICALERAGEKDRVEMERIIRNHQFSREEFDALVDLIKRYGGLDYTRQKALDHVDKAREALEVFGSSKTKEILFYVAGYALTRKK